MLANSVLLLCHDEALAERVRAGLEPGADLRVDAVVDFAEGCEAIREGVPGLIAIHLDGETGPRQVAHVLWLNSMRRRPAPVVTVGDTYREREAIDLIRMGVADHLSLADHLGKLGSVIATLVPEVQVAAPSNGPMSSGCIPRLLVAPTHV